MKANARTPAEIFGNNVRFVVPLFQRPYVWTEEDQWQPLWEDVQELARRVADAPPPVFGEPAPVPPHFLGAVVLESQATSTGYIEVRHVVDGQQRLTTLQLLLDAVQEVVAERGSLSDANGLQSLVLNNTGLTTQPFEKFKVWPTDRDQTAFTAAMDGTDTTGGALAATPIVKAHRFFASAALEWAEQEGADEIARRLGHLSTALARHLKLVVIDLEPGDNAQVIFESLNHRGSPLLAADLVKNLVFQVAQAQHLDVGALYREHWQELDEDFWREKQAQGRRLVPRIDLFLHHWMTMRLSRDVPMDRIFTDFREKIVKPSTDIAGLLTELAHDARIYATFDAQPPGSVPERFHYRVIRALDSAVVSPFLLWVMRHSPEELPVEQRDRALRAVESWLVRRALVRATSKDLNNTLLALLKRVRERPVAEIGDATVAFLEEQRAPSRVWPDDVTVSSVLVDLPLYSTLTRPRLRMVLEALEDSLRSGFGEGQPCPRELTVEHVMPQAWRESWAPALSQDEEVVAVRDNRLHTLGNLTLVSGKLNPAMSNRRWADSPESPGKRAYLLQHSQLKLNATLVVQHEHHWDDESIRRRTRDLTQQLLGVWPGPTRRASNAQAQPISPPERSAPQGSALPAAEIIPPDPAARTRRPVDVSLADLVAAGVVSRGTRFSGRYHGQTYSVAVRWDGSLESEGRAFASPTAAATALTGQEAVNGWLFWRTAGDTPISELRDLLRGER